MDFTNLGASSGRFRRILTGCLSFFEWEWRLNSHLPYTYAFFQLYLETGLGEMDNDINYSPATSFISHVEVATGGYNLMRSS